MPWDGCKEFARQHGFTVGAPAEPKPAMLPPRVEPVTGDLAERGIWARPLVKIARHGEELREGAVYVIAILSLNNVQGKHAVLLDTRGEPKAGGHDRSGWRTFDPKEGWPDAKICSWVDEQLMCEALELVQRDPRWQQFGPPP